MIVLGIETSCDETAASIVTDQREILSNVIFSQMEQHAPYGGVVPEIAARAHLAVLDQVIGQALRGGGVTWGDISAIAVTGGPGLIGGVMVGVMAAKAMAVSRNIPFIAVNHLEGHALTARLTDSVDYPFLLLLASGGHCQFLEVLALGSYRLLGSTLDDAAGEAFDKVAKLLGYEYPGGPILEKLALKGDPHRFDLPRPLRHRPGCDFSFAGLKTAAKTEIEKFDMLSQQDEKDLAASFQQAVGDCFVDRTENALRSASSNITTLVVAGGVAANQALRQRLRETCDSHNKLFSAPPLALCTDNAAMIAWVGIERLQKKMLTPLNFAPRPRWPLAEREKK